MTTLMLPLTQMWGHRAIELAEQLHDVEPVSDVAQQHGLLRMWAAETTRA